ncbi:alpha/beta hydrolase [Pedobacter puniceum]|uniref:Alpha/beta hydrolase fold domain-containing protein n=1 Tax=Pedobacter puniceum TaxID=2666136 RepID=A0A7K0FJB7_9SPHI|nr:alpha/beta hydrolase [Pedobacter puniceum]MRX45741.1 alpha/beta hydrolase fold domain-containing protein [Pedobacter puniceum]
MKKIIAFYCLILMGLTSKAQETPEFKKVEYPLGYTEQLNVVYTIANGWEGKMDLYLPPKDKGPSPVVINIHGGGWNKGSKESQTGFNTFFKKGYAVANIAYRLSQVAPAPAAVEDTRCALIYLIKNAKALNIDINKIVIMGGSAGGHLALMGGLLGNDTRFDTNCKGLKDVKVAAIINKYGIAELGDWPSKSLNMWLGDQIKNPVFVQSVSPIYHVKRNSPPVFIVHGDADPVVSYQQSVNLKKKLDEMGVKNTFITVEGGEHGKFSKEKNAEVNTAIMNFLKELGIHQ